MTSYTPRTYTGIGSRLTPAPVLATMRAIATRLATEGYVLRSGGASGADSAFEAGAGDAKDIYRTDTRLYAMAAVEQAEAIAARIHPAWDRCTTFARSLHTRNIFQVVGATLDTPSAFVVYWAPERDGEPQGGTRTAVLYARELGIPTFNLLHGSTAFEVYLQDIAQ